MWMLSSISELEAGGQLRHFPQAAAGPPEFGSILFPEFPQFLYLPQDGGGRGNLDTEFSPRLQINLMHSPDISE
jgi:hypothetical protein